MHVHDIQIGELLGEGRDIREGAAIAPVPSNVSGGGRDDLS